MSIADWSCIMSADAIREALVEKLRKSPRMMETDHRESWLINELSDAADMLAADAQQGYSLSLNLLERLSNTLVNLGYSTPEGGMEHFGAKIEGQLYNLCRGVDSLLDAAKRAQQVAVPHGLDQYDLLELSSSAFEEAMACGVARDSYERLANTIHKRMLAAAPQPPQANALDADHVEGLTTNSVVNQKAANFDDKTQQADAK